MTKNIDTPDGVVIQNGRTHLLRLVGAELPSASLSDL